MRNLFKYLPVLLVFFGCDGFLDREPYDKTSSDDFYNNTSELNSAVLACYNGIHSTLDREFFVTEVRSDNTRSSNQAPTSGTELEIAHLDLFKVETSNTLNNAYWENVYHNIANCNTVLQYLDRVDDPVTRNQFEAEARFIRAYHYFNLVRLYGPVFLVTERISPEVAKLYERSPMSDVYDLIIEDLKFGTTNLPVKYDDNNLGRIDQWGAKTLLGKVYLTLSDNGKDKEMLNLAKGLLEDVKDNSGYELLLDRGLTDCAYQNVFSIGNEMNKEMIFVSRYLSGGRGLGSPFANYFAPSASEDAVIYGSGSGYNCPTEDLINAYKSENGDTRKDVVLSETWVSKLGVTNHVSYVKKYLSQVTVRYDAENDWPVLRFADVLLMLGEIENELNGPTDIANEYLNATRERAGLDPITPANRVAYRAAMSKERRLEFAMENQRLYDLLRTGQLIDVMKEHYVAEQIRNRSGGSKSAYYGNNKYTTYVSDPLLKNWQLLLPIPYNVMIAAPNATQNTGY
ncbi:RagB/SusD family nutrient uptake outer membrane protein [Bacteroides sp.]|uniref:RagB/SusD family nutrient uptake outer membrane protein n=1 Tax=Bacteroides sp. TaxID=29523 RepID=UPI0025C547B6|nr:RagB/SusD family nutrient uptake outer membrane protein [Bacteroides sp.]